MLDENAKNSVHYQRLQKPNTKPLTVVSRTTRPKAVSNKLLYPFDCNAATSHGLPTVNFIICVYYYTFRMRRFA